jgi:hypothetical protein
MGRELQDYVIGKYNHVIFSSEARLSAIISDIKREVNKLEDKFPRCKKLKVQTYHFDQNGSGQIYVSPESDYDDNTVFQISWVEVHKLNGEDKL